MAWTVVLRKDGQSRRKRASRRLLRRLESEAALRSIFPDPLESDRLHLVMALIAFSSTLMAAMKSANDADLSEPDVVSSIRHSRYSTSMNCRISGKTRPLGN